VSTKSKLASVIGRVTGWDKDPASVFYLVVPLALLGFGLMLAIAILHYEYDGDAVFLYIWIGMIVLLFVALIPGFRMMRYTAKQRY
jgi:hypothetical protein